MTEFIDSTCPGADVWYLIAVNLKSFIWAKIHSLFLLFWHWYCYIGATFETNVLPLSQTHTKQRVFLCSSLASTTKCYSDIFSEIIWELFSGPIQHKTWFDWKHVSLSFSFYHFTLRHSLRQYHAKQDLYSSRKSSWITQLLLRNLEGNLGKSNRKGLSMSNTIRERKWKCMWVSVLGLWRQDRLALVCAAFLPGPAPELGGRVTEGVAVLLASECCLPFKENQCLGMKWLCEHWSRARFWKTKWSSYYWKEDTPCLERPSCLSCTSVKYQNAWWNTWQFCWAADIWHHAINQTMKNKLSFIVQAK